MRYRSTVASHFKRDFDAINPRLAKDYGITFATKNVRKDCGPNSDYPSGGAYIFGRRFSTLTDVTADRTFVAKWQSTSPQLKKYLLVEGWQKQWSRDQPIKEILDNFNNDTSIGVNYSKKTRQNHLYAQFDMDYARKP